MKYYETDKGYKRVKTSLYLTKQIYDRLDELSKKNELSLSETGSRLLVQSMGGGMIWLEGLSINKPSVRLVIVPITYGC